MKFLDHVRLSRELKQEIPLPVATNGEKYGIATQIKSWRHMNIHLWRLVRYEMRSGIGQTEALGLSIDNMKYYAGYFDEETRRRVIRLMIVALKFEVWHLRKTGEMNRESSYALPSSAMSEFERAFCFDFRDQKFQVPLSLAEGEL